MQKLKALVAGPLKKELFCGFPNLASNLLPSTKCAQYLDINYQAM